MLGRRPNCSQAGWLADWLAGWLAGWVAGKIVKARLVGQVWPIPALTIFPGGSLGGLGAAQGRATA